MKEIRGWNRFGDHGHETKRERSGDQMMTRYAVVLPFKRKT